MPLMFSSFFFLSAKFLLKATLTGASFPWMFLMGLFSTCKSLALTASLKLAYSFMLINILPSPYYLIWSYFFFWIYSSLLISSCCFFSRSVSLFSFSVSSSYFSSSLTPIFSLIFWTCSSVAFTSSSAYLCWALYSARCLSARHSLLSSMIWDWILLTSFFSSSSISWSCLIICITGFSIGASLYWARQTSLGKMTPSSFFWMGLL